MRKGNSEVLHDPLPEEQWTNTGYAKRLAIFAADEYRYIPTWHQWRHWDGKRWRQDDLNSIQEATIRLVRHMTDVSETITDEKGKQPFRSAALAHESGGSIASVIKLASSHPQFVRMPKDFDSDPMLLNTPSGVFDLNTFTVGPHDPKLMLSKMTTGSYHPEQLSNGHGRIFKQFLTRVQPAATNRSFISRLLGCMLEGRVTEQLIVIELGTGANGKSTFNEIIDFALGNYATYSDGRILSNPDEHPTGIANLAGRRLVFANEIGNINETLLKQLTSQEPLQARRMREDYFTFTPTHNIIATTNTPPNFATFTNEGAWRRIQLVPWDVQLPREEWDRNIGQRIHAEADFIVTWLLKGYKAYRKHGLHAPSTVTSANRQLRDEMDPVSAFIREHCITAPDRSSTAANLFTAYEKWQAKTGSRKLTQTAFGRSLSGKGYHRGRNAQGIVWSGLEVR